MTQAPQRRLSPGPSWAVLSEPASSFQSTHTEFDFDAGGDMTDDEPECDLASPFIRTPIAKRKASADDALSGHNPRKLPRLDLNWATSAGRPSSSSTDAGRVSRTQPSVQRKAAIPSAQDRPGPSRSESSSSTSNSDFPQTLSQIVQKADAQEKGKARERTRERNGESSPWTARKRTAQAKNIRKVTIASLLENAQKQPNRTDKSVPWNRIGPKWKPKRTSYAEEMAPVRPLDMARRRGDTIELTDSSDSSRPPRPSQSTTNSPRPSILARTDDPIVITSGSEDDRIPMTQPTQRRKSVPDGTLRKGTNRRGVPPIDVEVISISDSEEDIGTRDVGSRRPTMLAPSISTPPPPPSQRVASSARESTTALAPTREFASASSSTQPVEHLPLTAQDNDLHPPRSSSISFDPPPLDNLDDAFDEMDFNTTGDDIHSSGALDGWDDLDVGSSLATLPATTPTRSAVTAGASLPHKSLPTSQSRDNPNVDLDGDSRMMAFEEGEIDPDEGYTPRVRHLGTPKSGEIRSQELGRERSSAPTPSQPATSPVVTPTRVQPPFSVSQLLEHRALAIPDISSYRGVRFKRPLQETRENSFFSRALNGATRSAKAPESSGKGYEQRVGEESASPGTSTSVEVPLSVGKAANQDDADMQADTAIPTPEPSTSAGAVVPTPSLLPLQEKPPMVPNTQKVFSAQARSSNAEATTTVYDMPPASTQLAPSSAQAVSVQPPPATQPPVRSSSRPFIAPPRIPQPGTPLSLADVLNEVRRESLQRGEREQARKRSIASSSRTSTPMLPSPQPTRTIEKTPSLNDIRTLLKRNVGASQSPRLIPTPIPSHTSNEDSHAPPKPVMTSAPATTQVPPSTDVKVGPPSSSSSGARIDKNAVWSTPTPTMASVSELSASSSARARRRAVPIDPFKAFISPVHSRSTPAGNDRNGDAVHRSDPFISPTVARTCASIGAGWPSSQISKRHGRRESESAAFEACIVRNTPKEVAPESLVRAGTDVEVDTDTELVTSDAQFGKPFLLPSGSLGPPEGPGSPSPLPSRSLRVVPELGLDRKSGDGEEGLADGVNAVEVALKGTMDVDGQAEDYMRDAHVDATGADGRKPVSGDESQGGGENEPESGVEAEVDEADALLELASVHLSQPEKSKEEEEEVTESLVDGADMDGEMDVGDELTDSMRAEPSETGMVDEPEQEVENAMAIDEALQGLEITQEDKETAVPQMVLDDIPSPPCQRGANKAGLHVRGFSRSSPRTHVQRVVAKKGVEILSHSPTPDLVLPEDNITSFQEVYPGDADGQRRLEKVPAREFELEATPASSLASSRTASSTSLAGPRGRARLARRNPKERSLSRVASSVDPLDLLRQPSPDRAEEGIVTWTSPDKIGGYRVITWASYVAEQRERPPDYKIGKNLPHSLQDSMHALPASFRNSDVGRRIFEAHIQEAMGVEPGVPVIEIFDNEIGDEVTPKWEFHYTNEIWYGEGVPPPDIKGLKSCGCIGRCDPKSKTCACARRQQRWVQSYIDGDIIPSTWPGSPFVYDHKGILQRLECPIFECNRFCGCDEDCPNRVVQNGRRWPVHIVRTMHKGWGVSAGNKKIPKGSYIGIYAGELLTEQEGDERGKYYDLYGRTYLFTVDFHHLKLEMENPDEWENLYVVDAYHAGNFTRFLNHSCDPNCKIFACYIDDADVNKPLLAVFTTRDVEPWEELCFSYYGDIDEKREEVKMAKEAGEELVREHAVYAQCRCDSDSCIGQLFS